MVGPGRPPSMVPTTPVRPMPVRCGDAQAGQFGGDDSGGAHFLEGQFGMRVDVAADRHQARLDRRHGVADARLRVVGQRSEVVVGMLASPR